MCLNVEFEGHGGEVTKSSSILSGGSQVRDGVTLDAEARGLC